MDVGERPRCTKGTSHISSHVNTQVRGMLTCWHTSTLTHTPINISLQPRPHTQECTHAQVCAHRNTQPALTAPTTHHQSWPPAHILSPALALQGVKALFSSNTLIHPSPVLQRLTSTPPSPHHWCLLSLSLKLLCHFMVLRYKGNFARFTTRSQPFIWYRRSRA